MKKLGDIFEIKAIEYLKSKGYDLITTNFKSRYGEIDIICKKEDLIVFVEVKYRSSYNFGEAIESISKQKLFRLKNTIEHFCLVNDLDMEKIRFDVITFQKNNIGIELNHYKNLEI